jgi:hypothetical protein
VTRAALIAIPVVLIPTLGVVQGGFHPDAWVWSAALVAWAAALGLVLSGSGRLQRDFWWVIAAASLLLWTLASALWSAEPSQSLLETRRMLVYGAVVLAVVTLARRDASRLLLAATHAGVTALVLYSLTRYLLGPRTNLGFEGHLLSEPLGYANAVGILAAMGILLSLGRTADLGSAGVRAASAATVPLLALALDLSGSHASWLALAIGFTAMAALHPNRRGLARAVGAVAPATAVAILVGQYSELTSQSSARMSGPLVALIAVACGAVAALTQALVASPRTVSLPRTEGRPRPRRLAVAAVLAVAALGGLAVALGGATEPRASYYHVAWHEYLSHRLLGSGAGTFGHFWLESGRVAQWGGALDAHSLYLETLAELGPIGLCLLAAFLLYPLGRAVERRALPPVAPAAGAATAFLVHAGLDWDWELPAVVVAGLTCGAVVAFAEREDDGDEMPAPRAARAAALAAALIVGAASIAGARSTTEPSAASLTTAPFTIEAPQGGASIQHVRTARASYL